MDFSQLLRRKWPERLIVIAIAAAVGWQLFVPPPIGIADNGDFPRIMGRFDIGYLSARYEDRYYYYFLSRFGIDKKNYWDSKFVSSQSLLDAFALPVNRLLAKPGFFDIRSVGLIHLVLELWAVWLLLLYVPVTGIVPRTVLFGMALLVLTDVGYVSYFNSFYSEPGSFVFLLLTLGTVCMTIRRPVNRALIGYGVAGLLFVTSKPQNFAAGIVLAAFTPRLCALRADVGWRRACAGVAFVLFSGSIYYYTLTPADMITKPSYYLSVFYDILPHSPAPRQDLTELGLDPDLAKYSGSRPWSPGAPMGNPDFQRAFFDKMSFSKIIRFHLSHPVRLLGTLERSARYAPLLESELGNYDQSAGHPPLAISNSFNFWSRWRQEFSPGSLSSLALFFAVSFCGVGVLYFRRKAPADRLFLELQAALLLMAVLQFLAVAIAQGTHEPVKHLFLFDFLMDICFVNGVLWLVSVVARYER